jgi:integrative and conjugative element protein (TIGR02256 family)
MKTDNSRVLEDAPIPQVLKNDFKSKDGKFVARFTDSSSQFIANECLRSGKLETGGILIGKYIENFRTALVSEVLGPTSDSIKKATTFERGTKGLEEYLANLFKEGGTYYLGEWHFHPFSSPDPSNADLVQLRKIALNKTYACPEPLMLIVGGDPSRNLNFRIFSFTVAGGHVELL